MQTPEKFVIKTIATPNAPKRSVVRQAFQFERVRPLILPELLAVSSDEEEDEVGAVSSDSEEEAVSSDSGVEEDYSDVSTDSGYCSDDDFPVH